MVFLLLHVLAAFWLSSVRAQLSPEWIRFEDFILRYNKPYHNDSDVSLTRFSAFQVCI